MAKKIKKPDWRLQANKWKAGEVVWSADLGGMGPGYEQCIQNLLWEILVNWKGDKLPEPDGKNYPKEYSDFVDRLVHALDKDAGGFTGAQVGAAKATAYQFMKYGYDHMMKKLPEDRKIMVSKHFPRVPETYTI